MPRSIGWPDYCFQGTFHGSYQSSFCTQQSSFQNRPDNKRSGWAFNKPQYKRPFFNPRARRPHKGNKTELLGPRRRDCPGVPGGGRLAHFFPMWVHSTMDEWTLEIVSRGYSLEFFKLPPSRFLQSPLSPKRSKRQVLFQAIEHLITIEAVESVPTHQRG